VMYTTVY